MKNFLLFYYYFFLTAYNFLFLYFHLFFFLTNVYSAFHRFQNGESTLSYTPLALLYSQHTVLSQFVSSYFLYIFFFILGFAIFFFFAFFHCPSNDFSLLSDGGLVTALLQYCTTSRNRKWVVKREEKRESVDERWLERKR